MREKKRVGVVFYILFFGAVVSAWFVGRSGNTLENATSYLIYPVLYVQHKITQNINCFFAHKQSLAQYQDLVAQLSAERDALMAKNIELNGAINYEDEIKELISFKKQYDTSTAILAQVLIKQFSDQSHYFLIDKGQQANVQLDMVAVYKNCLLGKVVEVLPYYSKVLLITDRMCKVAAYCAQTHASGIAQGGNIKDSLGLYYVSHLAQIKINDLVLSSGDGLIFPKGFALGTIKSAEPNQLFYDIEVQTLVDLKTVAHCYLIAKGACCDQAAVAQLCESHAQALKEDQIDGSQITKTLAQSELEPSVVMMTDPNLCV